VSVPSSTGGEVLKMEPTHSSETSAFNTQTPGKYPEDNLSQIPIAVNAILRLLMMDGKSIQNV
jgi:hypothetical protein